MTDIEERLRHDLKQRSERARPGSIRPLRVPSASRRSRARYRLASARRSRAARVVVPATAMVAVIAIIAGVWVAGHPGGERPAAAGSSAGMPKYYVTLKTVLRGKNQAPGLLAGVGPGRVTAVVRDSLTGALLDSVMIARVPRGKAWTDAESWITAAANDRVFAIRVASHVDILRLGSDGQVAGLSPLPAWMSKQVSGSYRPGLLSPAGTELAFTDALNSKVTVLTLATGATKRWRARPSFVDAVQWPGTGNKVLIYYGGQSGGPPPEFRLLDVSGAGGGVLAHSRPVYSSLFRNGYNISSPLMTPNGELLFLAHSVYTRGGVQTTACRVVEFSSGARRLLRVLYKAHAPSKAVGYFPPCGVVSVGPTGLNLLIADFGSDTGFGRLDGSRITALPGWADNERWPQAAW